MICTLKKLGLAVAFAGIAQISGVSAECLSLKDSQGCPGFAQEFISTNATTRFVWYPLNDINAFDKALTEYVNGQSNFDEFQAVFRCSGLDDLGGFQKDHGKSVIRYHRSIICADLIASKDNTDECYKAPTKGRRSTDPGMELAKIAAVQVGTGRPKALCRATCNEWVDSLETIISNSTLCAASSGINREATLESLRDKCKTAQFNGSKGSCVSGDDNEPGTCGYQRVEDWCKNCKYASDYPDACMSAGIHVSSSNNNLHGDDSRTRGGYQPTATNTHETLDSLIADLEKQAHQERLYRIAAIILSIAVGICLIALMILILTSGSRNSGAAGILGRRKDAANNAGLDGVLGMGTAERVERTMDFVDCFVSAVGKPRPVMRHFFARRDDEISLQQGDIVTLQMAFDDGWVVGKNLTTGGEGTFPLMCVMDNLPPSMPAQWSVLPENKMASNDNVRRPTQAVTRNSHPSSQNGSGSVVSNASHYHSSIGISAMGNLSDPARRQGLGNMSRMSNLTVAPAITSTNIPSHASSRSSRPHHGGSTVLDHTSIDHVHRQPIENNHENTGILGRLLGAFTHGHTMTFGRISHADIGSHSLEPLKEESRGPVTMLKRLVLAPFGNREPDSVSDAVADEKSEHSGRPSSFNVNHVVHVGVDTPQYPRPGDMARQESDSRQNVRAGERGYFRQPAIDGREIAEVARQRAMANTSAETYKTAEQVV